MWLLYLLLKGPVRCNGSNIINIIYITYKYNKNLIFTCILCVLVYKYIYLYIYIYLYVHFFSCGSLIIVLHNMSILIEYAKLITEMNTAQVFKISIITHLYNQ